MNTLTPRSIKEAEDYYRMTLENGTFTREHLIEQYNKAKVEKENWKEHSRKGVYQNRDYESYCNSQIALKRVLGI